MEGEKSNIEKGEEIKIENLETEKNGYKYMKKLFETYERKEKSIRRKYLISSILFLLGVYLLIFFILFQLWPSLYNISIDFLGEKICKITFFSPLFILIGAFGMYRVGAPWNWGSVEERFLLYSYGTFNYCFEGKSRQYLRKFIDELEGELEYAEEMLFFDKKNEEKLKTIIDKLKKYILPNLGDIKNFDNDKKREIINIFEDFSLKVFDIMQKNEKTDILDLLSRIEKSEDLFEPKKIHENIWEKISFKFSRIELSKRLIIIIAFIFWAGLVFVSWKFDKWEIFGTISSFGLIYFLLKEVMKK